MYFGFMGSLGEKIILVSKFLLFCSGFVMM